MTGGSKTWEEHWATLHTPWDAGASAPSLRGLLTKGVADPMGVRRGRALVPGCGAGYDVFSLAEAGFQATGLDIAPSAKRRFSELRTKRRLGRDEAQLIIDDFFQVSPANLGGTFDFLWDYTFFCAIDPGLRTDWREAAHRLLAPGAKLAMLVFPVIPGAPRDQGPPFPLDPDEVVELVGERFRLLCLEKVSESHPGREGKEWLAVFERPEAH